MNAAVFYRGPSLLDGAPIVGIVSGLDTDSHNAKTGAMLQTWILVDALAPAAAVISGDDRSVCGDCALRGDGPFGRACYVKVGWAPQGVWKVTRGAAAVAPAGLARGREIRLGAYGDPAAIPFMVWSELLTDAAGWTGYTHQWRACVRRFQSLVMASVEDVGQARAAQHDGWRTFRARLAAEPLQPDEIICPASAEAGHRTTCHDCQLCRGAASGPGVKSIAIIAHGGSAKWFRSPRLGATDAARWIPVRPFSQRQ